MSWDVVKAYVWFARAAVNGSEDAHQSMAIERYLTPEQLQRAHEEMKSQR